MAFKIIKDIISHHPELIEDKILILRLDNCQEQYKCKYIFHEMKELPKEHGIKLIWLESEPGHGRGLVDAMSSFGCKQHLKHAILIGVDKGAKLRYFTDVNAVKNLFKEIRIFYG